MGGGYGLEDPHAPIALTKLFAPPVGSDGPPHVAVRPVKRSWRYFRNSEPKLNSYLSQNKTSNVKQFSHAKELHKTAGLTRVTFAPQPETSVYEPTVAAHLRDQPAATRARWASYIPKFTNWPGCSQLGLLCLI